MTFRERLAIDKERAALAAQLREAIQVARTAIGALESAGRTFAIYANCQWMKDIDPDNTGPRMVSHCNATHFGELTAGLTERLKGME